MEVNQFSSLKNADQNLVGSVITRCIFIPLNWHRRPNIEPKCFRITLVKRPQTKLGSAFQANLDTLNSKKFSDSARSHSGRLLSSTQIHSRYMQRYAPKNSGYDTAYSSVYGIILNDSCRSHEIHLNMQSTRRLSERLHIKTTLRAPTGF